MGIRLEVLGNRHLEWLRNLRNQNREFFLNKDLIPDIYVQRVWFMRSCERGDLNLVIVDIGTDKRVGFVSLYDITPGGIAIIGRMMVEDEFKHQGYMQKALIKVFKIAKEFLGITEVTLEVLKSNPIATDFYIKMGFTTYGLCDEYYIMRKTL